MTEAASRRRWRGLVGGLRRVLPSLSVLAGMVAAIAWLAGWFTPGIPAGSARDVLPPAPAGARFTVHEQQVQRTEYAVGTIEPVQEVRLAARILARIKHLHVVHAGQQVQQDEVLVELDDADLRAAEAAAGANLRAAEQALGQAQRDLERVRSLHGQQIASQEQLEQAETKAKNAAATRDAAQQALQGASTALSFATIRSPLAGLVVDKLVNEGDVVTPGQVLMVLYDDKRMQLVASVREGLAERLQVGSEVAVRIDALDLDCHGKVSQIVPRAERGSRAFDVKVTGPCPPGIFSGMYGRLCLPLGTEPEIRVPGRAIRSIGQVDLVFVIDGDGRLQRRFVRLGDVHGDEITVLSGLATGETILADAKAGG
jgi:RND family efflux transporter MFP subunit